MVRTKRGLMFLFITTLLCACQMNESKQLSPAEKLDKVFTALDKKYNILTATIDDKRNVIEVDIPDTKNEEDMQYDFKQVLQKHDIGNFTLKINKKDFVKVKKQRKWREVTSALYYKFQEDDQLKGVLIGDYDMQVIPKPLIELFIPFNSSDTSAQTYAANVKTQVQEFLETNKMKNLIKNESYDIKIYSKDEHLIQS
ncbi:DUF4030 domain-containing protein [Priestia megaterium]|uniref:DUF4030 domain-containing protein n=1 Tax=Priestia megaterium TaxID=1404 RepID=UPI00070A9C21|nr:DUF4030 domain-containing protein [Priestia megaterium]KRE07946.1 hypothetical protein ASE46_24235 [Bacillus sp. Root239]